MTDADSVRHEVDRLHGDDVIASWGDPPETAAQRNGSGSLLASMVDAADPIERALFDLTEHAHHAAIARIEARSGYPSGFEQARKALAHALDELADAERGAHQFPSLVNAYDAPEPPPQEWVAYPWIPRGLPGLWTGPDGSGKDSTFLALSIASAAGAVPYNHDGFRASDPTAVVVASAEDPQALQLSRLHALARGAEVDARDTLSRIHVLGSESGFNLESEAWTDHLIAEIKRVGASLGMIGPLREIITGSENDSEAVAPLIRRVRRICAETGAAICINHHAGKPREGATKSDRIRGSSALRAFSRWAVWVEGAPENRVLMEVLKLTVGAPPDPWVLQRSIITGPDGSWWKASFNAANPDALARTDAEKAVRQVLESAPGSTSSQIRDYCTALKIPPTESSKALRTLTKLGFATHDPGSRGAKLWRLKETFDHPALPEDAR